MAALYAGELLTRSLDYERTLENICTAAVTTVADMCIVDLGEAGDTRPVAAAHRNPRLTAAVQNLGSHLESLPDRPMHPVCQVLTTGEPFFAPHIDEAWIEENSTRPEHADFMREMKYSSLVAVPVHSQVYGVTGVMTLVTTQDGRPPFTERTLLFAQDLGRRCGAAIGKARLFNETVTALARFQNAALPRVLPSSDAVQFFAHYEPATSTMLIGGDWYDAFPLPDGRIGISMGDVSGHGVDASVLMASMKNALRSALVAEPDVQRALAAGDYVMRTETDGDQFCTANLAVLDPRAMTLTCISAGHPGPKIWDPQEQRVVDPFRERGLPLGFRHLADGQGKAQTLQLSAGMMIVFFTDGVVEWEHDFLAGERALEQALALEPVRNAEEPARALRECVVRGDAADDLAILVLRIPVTASP